MPLTPIRTIISEMVDGDKFEITTTESGAHSYAINGQSVGQTRWDQRLALARQRDKAKTKPLLGFHSPTNVAHGWLHLKTTFKD